LTETLRNVTAKLLNLVRNLPFCPRWGQHVPPKNSDVQLSAKAWPLRVISSLNNSRLFLKPIATLQSDLNWESKFNYFSPEMEFRLLTYLGIWKQNINSGSRPPSNLHVLPVTHHSLVRPSPDKTDCL